EITPDIFIDGDKAIFRVFETRTYAGRKKARPDAGICRSHYKRMGSQVIGIVDLCIYSGSTMKSSPIGKSGCSGRLTAFAINEHCADRRPAENIAFYADDGKALSWHAERRILIAELSRFDFQKTQIVASHFAGNFRAVVYRYRFAVFGQAY